MWPDWLVRIVHGIKGVFGWFSLHSWMGIPLDLIFRFVFLGVLHGVLRRKRAFAVSALIGLSVLLAKEVFDTFAVRSWHKIHWPGFLDLEDVVSGVLGIGVAEGWIRWMRRTERRDEVEAEVS